MKKSIIVCGLICLGLIGMAGAQEYILPDLAPAFGTVGGSASLNNIRVYTSGSQHRVVSCDDWETVGPSVAGQRILSFTLSTINVGNGDLRIQHSSTADGTAFIQRYGVRSEGALYAEEYEISRLPRASIQGARDYPLASMALYNMTDDGGFGDRVSCQVKRACCLVSFGQVCPVERPFPLPQARDNIHAGNRDTYGTNFLDQYIPIDGLPSGYYWVEVISNPFGHIIESNYDNNAVYFPIFLDQEGAAVEVIDPEYWQFRCTS